jgi:TetR/AcrR family transcriptional regulator, mexCD-oprJ operon repressor
MMSASSPKQALQQRVSAAILDGAVQIFVRAGEQASMNDVAEAAGVARATVYRYFPTRDALLDELIGNALREVETRLTAARIDEVDAEEGVVRAVRALVEVGDLFVLLTRERARGGPEQYERKLMAPLRRVLERAQASGDIRRDIPGNRLIESLVGGAVGLLTSSSPLGTEDLTATISSLFLEGARARGPRSR